MDSILETMRAFIAATPERWRQLAQTLPEDLLRRPAAPGEWSAVDCLQHLIDSEKVLQFRVGAFLEGRDFPDFNPDSQGSQAGTQTVQALVAEFARLRGISLRQLEALSPADLDRQVRHSELGRVTLREMLHHWAGHDLNHTVQAERALLQPFIQGLGPWRVYYRDHIQEP